MTRVLQNRRISAASLVAAVLAIVLLASACNPQELHLRNLVNNTRTAKGLPALAGAGDLDAKAHSVAASVANQARLSHSNLRDGVSPSWGIIGENLAAAGSIQAAHDALMASPGHRANILDGRFKALGTGAVQGANGLWYVAEEFGG
jgi:uncharacterized protein YkwD